LERGRLPHSFRTDFFIKGDTNTTNTNKESSKTITIDPQYAEELKTIREQLGEKYHLGGAFGESLLDICASIIFADRLVKRLPAHAQHEIEHDTALTVTG
jgi:hypothetical protein